MAKFASRLFFIFLLLISFTIRAETNCASNTMFNVGAGIYDITGPAAEQGMMGYGMIAQKTAGIYQRLWARAFIIESPCNQKRIAFVNADLGQIFQGVQQQVIKKLQAKYGNQYTDKNVLLTATHTHSGPGGYSTYAFYNLTTLGFSRDNFNAIVDGIVAAIERAHTNMGAAEIKLTRGELDGISFNRSPTAYALNPADERKNYSHDFDNDMTLIRFDAANGKAIGLINWFALHGVSMNNKNHLINGDNKGYAEYLFEKGFDKSGFVAAFAQANAGDVSPNPYGHEGGTGLEGLQAIEKAGSAQYKKAKELYDSAEQKITGGVEYIQRFIAMDSVVVSPKFTGNTFQVTCPAAIGVSMLAGTQDGEGVGKQGITCESIQKTIPTFVCELSTTECQGVKPIALSTGTMKPYPWTPNILPLQIIKIGNLVIAAVPFELTTMSGRRIKQSLQQEFKEATIVLSTLANAYAGYVTTFEEYQLQRYEGASTHFGPWTLAAIQQSLVELAKAMKENREIPNSQEPLDLSKFQINLQPGVVFDSAPLIKHFGDVDQNVAKTYQAGDTVKAVFWGAHPKNNYRIQQTFLEVQRYEHGNWVTVSTDNDWDTEYHWERDGLSASKIAIMWRIPTDVTPGLYRIVHYGDAKSVLGKITPYTGYSGIFTVN